MSIWVFGYGSLMWDGWEKEFNGGKYERAVLKNYCRDFNKKSVVNWGTHKQPCPTLGLTEKRGADCIGTAFEFDSALKETIFKYLQKREGPSFVLKELEIALSDNLSKFAITSVNHFESNTFIGHLPLIQRLKMVKKAFGKEGPCVDYIRNIYSKLNDLEIEDSAVIEFYNAIK